MKKQTPKPFGLCGGQFSHEHVLLGVHYGDMSNHEGRDMRKHPLNIWAYFEDYVKYMDEDLRKTSYVDFWRWWYVIERYKGDERGLAELDHLADLILERGLKLKIDIAWNTWWSLNKDWEAGSNIPLGPENIDEWIHLCTLLGRRFRGKIGLWDLQGEANNIEHYWQKASNEHVFEMYKKGYLAFKSVDPDAMIGAAGASPSVPAYSPEGNAKIDASLQSWYETNMKACKGHFDNIPINFFADVADPYQGGIPFYTAIEGILKKIGDKTTEIGMGETSVQWAETTETAATDNLNQEKQAYRLNEAYGRLLSHGMNKIITWATEFAPGGGWWPWRWGLRNYEDWWGVWPESHKVPGTRIVWRYDKDDGTTWDLRPEWSRPADPYYPAGEVWNFWCQLAPAGAEALSLPVTTKAPEKGLFMTKSTFLQTRNEAVAVVYSEEATAVKLSLNAVLTGWAGGTKLLIKGFNESIDFKTGIHTKNWSGEIDSVMESGTIQIEMPVLKDFTTIRILLVEPDFNAAFDGAVIPKEVQIGEEIGGYVVVKNTGELPWANNAVQLCGYNNEVAGKKPASGTSFKIDKAVAPGETAAVGITLPAQDAAQRASFSLRMWSKAGGWFGPMLCVSTKVVETEAPRKLVAYREMGHIRLKWFAPKSGSAVKYDLYRADGFQQPMSLLATLDATEYVDSAVEMDKAYYYHVVAVRGDGSKSRPSNEDNARAMSAPRIYDAEVVEHNVPARVRIGDTQDVTIRFRNTGTKTWDLTQPEKLRYWMQTTQIWGSFEEKILSGTTLTGKESVAPGDEISVTFPYVGPKTGAFENHWILRFEVVDDPAKNCLNGPVKYAYFGTPLLVETVVEAK